MSPEVTAALIAAVIALIGLVANFIVLFQMQKHEQELRQMEIETSEKRVSAELTARHAEWQEGYREELRRNLIQESTLETVRARMRIYGEIWRDLKITSGYEWRNLPDPKAAIKQLVNRLTDYAYGEAGMLMSDNSRRLLTHLRYGCGGFLRDELKSDELRRRAHLLKHSLRSDLGIDTYEYKNALNEIASRLGKVDDWATPN